MIRYSPESVFSPSVVIWDQLHEKLWFGYSTVTLDPYGYSIGVTKGISAGNTKGISSPVKIKFSSIIAASFAMISLYKIVLKVTTGKFVCSGVTRSS